MINLISIFFQFVILYSWMFFGYFMYEYALRMIVLYLFEGKGFRNIIYAHVNFQINFTFMLIDMIEGRLWKVNMK